MDLPCGLRLENRLAKAAMSDALGDGAGQPTIEQIELYRRWARGGIGLSIIGEVQVDPRFPERPGNLVLGASPDRSSFERLAVAGSEGTTRLWPQLGHAGALAHASIAQPAGPSALDVAGLRCAELSVGEVEALPFVYAAAARRASEFGFSGVEVHAGRGFLLSQFLSALFNRRTDGYSAGPYFVDFARRARSVTPIPLMLTGGFKTRREAEDVLASGTVDLVGLARALVVDPDLASQWLGADPADPRFPRFASRVPGGVTAWYTMRLTDIAQHLERGVERSIEDAIGEYERRDRGRVVRWNAAFTPASPRSTTRTQSAARDKDSPQPRGVDVVDEPDRATSERNRFE